MAAEIGFEPIQTESESAVLPLHNSALATTIIINTFYLKVKTFFRFSQKRLIAVQAISAFSVL